MKTENKFKVGDYVWVNTLWWKIKHTIGRIKEIQGDDAGVQRFTIATLDNRQVVFRTKDQITPVTDSELAWFLVTNEN